MLTQALPAQADRDKRILFALSGGVDSAVACKLALDAGWQGQAVMMKNWEADDEDCTYQQDLEDASLIAENLKLPLAKISFSWEYYEQVFTPMLDGYRQGQTPNPDVYCNTQIKYGALLSYAQSQGFDAVVTGHYADWCMHQGEPRLKLAQDTLNDQTYFLHRVPAKALTQAMWPLASLEKKQVRELAEAWGFHNASKPSSTGICFIEPKNFSSLLQQHIPSKIGSIINAQGQLLGTHQGVNFYTEGQRRGLGIGGVHGERNEPWFVTAKDLASNQLMATQPSDPLYPVSQLVLREWQAHTELLVGENQPLAIEVRCRHRQPLQKATLSRTDSNQICIAFNQPQPPMGIGQELVAYLDGMVLGGGVIDQLRSTQQRAQLQDIFDRSLHGHKTHSTSPLTLDSSSNLKP